MYSTYTRTSDSERSSRLPRLRQSWQLQVILSFLLLTILFLPVIFLVERRQRPEKWGGG